MWNDLAFWKKLTIAFGTLLALLIVSVGISLYGIDGIQDQNRQTRYANEIHDLFTEKNIDHYRWLTTVDSVLMDGKSSRLDVETDDHRCKLGAWLYGEARKTAEAVFPGLAPLLKQLEGPHARMHQSAEKIDAVLAGRDGADSAAVTLAAIEIHRNETAVALKDLGRVMESILTILDQAAQQTNDQLTRRSHATKVEILATAAIALIAGVLLSLFMTRYITTRIGKLTSFSQSLAAGDFTAAIDIDQKDEIGALAQSLGKTRTDLSRMFGRTIDEVVGLSSSSSSLFDVSQQLAEGAGDMTGRADTVAAAAEEMSSNMNSVAAASEQAATNVNMVATAAEEMTSTVRDIAGNSEKGRAITQEAVAKAESASLKVNELGAAAAQISKVTEVITEISEQTNLLALNATIEAARAGEAGKGFAVVANEIKELAKQTAEATQDIKTKVGTIQSTTDGTVREIEQITSVIRSVNDIVATIASAVEQQSAATQEIAQNVAQASTGIAEVNQNVAQSSTVAAEIARDIAQVSRISGEINTASDRVNDDAGNLSSAAKSIKTMMNAFKIQTSSDTAATPAVEAAAVPDLIRWDGRIQLGIKRIDSQHKRLVDLINALNRAMKQRKGRDALNKVFADLVDYTKRHFGDEEVLMKKYGYAGLGEQEAQHRHFEKKMGEMQQQVKSGNAMVTMDLMDFLKEWLVKHIQGTDKKYQAFFKSKGVA